MVVEMIQKGLYQVVLSDDEEEEIYKNVPTLEDRGIGINVGENLLEKDTMWFILCEMNGIKYHTKTSLHLVEKLKAELYVEE